MATLACLSSQAYAFPYAVTERLRTDEANKFAFVINSNLEYLESLIRDLYGKTANFLQKAQVEEIARNESFRRTIHARRVITDQGFELVSGNVQDQLFELAQNKLSKNEDSAIDFRTMENDLILGGPDYTGVNLGIGDVTSPEYPIHIRRSAPQVYIETEGEQGQYVISIATESLVSGTTNFLLVSSGEYAAQSDGDMFYMWDKLWFFGSWGDSNMYYSEDGGTTWQIHSESLPTSAGLVNGKSNLLDRLIMFGLDTGSAVRDNVWSFDGNTWTQNKPNTNEIRVAEDGVIIDYDGAVYLMGGHSPRTGHWSGYGNRVYKSTNLVTWTELGAADWTGRQGLTATVFNGKLVIIAGGNYTGRLNDVWSTTDGSNWTEETSGSTMTFASRYRHGTWNTGERVYVGFGYNKKDDLYYSNDLKNWIKVLDDAACGGRYKIGFEYYNDKLYVAGGQSASGTEDDVWSYYENQAITYFYGKFSLKHQDGREFLRYSEQDDLTYIMPKLGFNTDTTGRYIEDDADSYQIDISTHVQMPELTVDGDINNIEGALTDDTVTTSDIKDDTILVDDLSNNIDARSKGFYASSATWSNDSDMLDGRNYDAFVSTQGDSMSGNLTMNSNRIVYDSNGEVYAYWDSINQWLRFYVDNIECYRIRK